jgi:hypothetical protein
LKDYVKPEVKTNKQYGIFSARVVIVSLGNELERRRSGEKQKLWYKNLGYRAAPGFACSGNGKGLPSASRLRRNRRNLTAMTSDALLAVYTFVSHSKVGRFTLELAKVYGLSGQ